MPIFSRLFAVVACAGITFGGVSASAATGPKSDHILPSVISVDTTNHTAVLPILRGEFNGTSVWYIVTDASDRAVAQQYHAVYSPSLGSIGSDATQRVSLKNGIVHFSGVPNFAPARTYVASAGGFPPKSATPGSTADGAYSPFIASPDFKGVINAPIIALGDGPFDVTHHTNTEDRVLAIDTKAKRVTLVLARGFFDDKPIYYISTDASDPVAASVERSTYVPKLAKANAGSTIPIGVVVRGPQTGSNAQGLAFLALRTPLGSDATLHNASTIMSSFNVLSQIPNRAHLYAPNAYSPLWAVQVVPKHGTRLTSYAAYAGLGPKAAGFVVNCPVIAFGDENAY